LSLTKREGACLELLRRVATDEQRRALDALVRGYDERGARIAELTAARAATVAVARLARAMDPAPSAVDPERAATVREGRLVISAPAILQLALEGLDEWEISRRLDVNKYVVEKVLRDATDRSVRRLAGDGFSTREIAAELRLTLRRVNRVLETPAFPAGAERAEPAACAASKRDEELACAASKREARSETEG
jgi:hypothetical protein